MLGYSPVGTILLNTKNNKYYIIIETSYNGDDDYYSEVEVIELESYNKLGAEFNKSEIENNTIRIICACDDELNYTISDVHSLCKVEKLTIYKKGE